MRTIVSCFTLIALGTWSCSSTHTESTSSPAKSSQHVGVNGLRIDGDVPARSLSMADLEALSPSLVTWTHKDRSLTYSAVTLEAVLRSVGVDPGSMAPGTAPSDKRAGWKYAVIATATDGFQAAFSVAEVFHDMGNTAAFVAVRENDAPIGAADGPLRLIVTTDHEASRSVRNLERLTIVDLRRVVH